MTNPYLPGERDSSAKVELSEAALERLGTLGVQPAAELPPEIPEIWPPPETQVGSEARVPGNAAGREFARTILDFAEPPEAFEDELEIFGDNLARLLENIKAASTYPDKGPNYGPIVRLLLKGLTPDEIMQDETVRVAQSYGVKLAMTTLVNAPNVIKNKLQNAHSIEYLRSQFSTESMSKVEAPVVDPALAPEESVRKPHDAAWAITRIADKLSLPKDRDMYLRAYLLGDKAEMVDLDKAKKLPARWADALQLSLIKVREAVEKVKTRPPVKKLTSEMTKHDVSLTPGELHALEQLLGKPPRYVGAKNHDVLIDEIKDQPDLTFEQKKQAAAKLERDIAGGLQKVATQYRAPIILEEY